MSSDGSAFADGGGGQFLQEPSSKRSKFEPQANVVESAHIMEGERRAAFATNRAGICSARFASTNHDHTACSAASMFC